MSAMDVDKSLDEIIATRPKGSRGRGSRRGTSTPRPAASARPQQQGQASGARAKYAGAIPAGRPQQQQLGVNPLVQQQKQATSEALKVIISKLPLDVEEESVRELMTTTVGQVKVVELAYDNKGKSKGIATVIFRQKGSAQKAFEQYNNRMIDQKRPLKVEVVVDPSKVPLAARVAPRPVPAAAPPAAASRGAGPIRRGAAPRGGAAKRAPRPKKTAEDLDKEMLEYAAAGTTTTTA
ncbi:hypothetical protein HD553DRAFT_302602 [Filobasidium floriforme]|uniref:uncharacterized protein n=1 Tax=Filobasidium floriforme TaxID=5210 RepID=UPI001E8CBA84|nr:uncharacterized protein HD553DRAFT_302602 [Filobasidium floriforme]KAH8090513.1 hypothetical protein HD553DRAFT_302602 [Filobasidium floriforme]